MRNRYVDGYVLETDAGRFNRFGSRIGTWSYDMPALWAPINIVPLFIQVMAWAAAGTIGWSIHLAVSVTLFIVQALLMLSVLTSYRVSHKLRGDTRRYMEDIEGAYWKLPVDLQASVKPMLDKAVRVAIWEQEHGSPYNSDSPGNDALYKIERGVKEILREWKLTEEQRIQDQLTDDGLDPAEFTKAITDGLRAAREASQKYLKDRS